MKGFAEHDDALAWARSGLADEHLEPVAASDLGERIPR